MEILKDIKFNNGPTVSTTSVTVIDSSKAILLDATESYPLSYIQQLMFIPAGDYIISLYEIIFNDPSYEPSKSYIRISFGSTVILDNYIAANYSDWSQLNFLMNIPSDTTDNFKIEAIYSTTRGVRISIYELNLKVLTMSPVGGFLSNEDFATPDIAVGVSNLSYANATTESSSTIVPSWFIKGAIRINDSVNVTDPWSGLDSYTPSPTNQYVVFFATSTFPLTYMRQPISLTTGTYLVSLFYVLHKTDPLGSSNFQIFFDNAQIGAITTIDNRYWTYYSFTFNVSADTTADFQLQNTFTNQFKRISISNLKLRNIG